MHFYATKYPYREHIFRPGDYAKNWINREKEKYHDGNSPWKKNLQYYFELEIPVVEV